MINFVLCYHDKKGKQTKGKIKERGCDMSFPLDGILYIIIIENPAIISQSWRETPWGKVISQKMLEGDDGRNLDL